MRWLISKDKRLHLVALYLFTISVVTAVALTTESLPQERPEQAVKKDSTASQPGLFLDRPNLPARIGYMPLGAYHTLENHSDKRIIRYRLGCAIEENGHLKILNKRKEEITDLPPANVSKSSIPFTALGLRQVKKKCIAKRAKIAVVNLTFADGTTWKIEDGVAP